MLLLLQRYKFTIRATAFSSFLLTHSWRSPQDPGSFHFSQTNWLSGCCCHPTVSRSTKKFTMPDSPRTTTTTTAFSAFNGDCVIDEELLVMCFPERKLFFSDAISFLLLDAPDSRFGAPVGTFVEGKVTLPDAVILCARWLYCYHKGEMIWSPPSRYCPLAFIAEGGVFKPNSSCGCQKR